MTEDLVHPVPAPVAELAPDGHVHTHLCWWDFREARWTCAPCSPIATLGDILGDGALFAPQASFISPRW